MALNIIHSFIHSLCLDLSFVVYVHDLFQSLKVCVCKLFSSYDNYLVCKRLIFFSRAVAKRYAMMDLALSQIYDLCDQNGDRMLTFSELQCVQKMGNSILGRRKWVNRLYIIIYKRKFDKYIYKNVMCVIIGGFRLGFLTHTFYIRRNQRVCQLVKNVEHLWIWNWFRNFVLIPSLSFYLDRIWYIWPIIGSLELFLDSSLADHNLQDRVQ